MTKYIGKYTYAHPEHKKTCEVESNIQAVIAKVKAKHGPTVIGDTSAMRHFTGAFGCTGNVEAIKTALKDLVPALLAKHGKKAFTIRVQRFGFCPGPAPIVAVTPARDSVDWNFFTEFQAALLMNPAVNAAHPDYAGADKITKESDFPAGFLDLKRAIDGGATLEDAAHRWMWPHMSAFQIKDTLVGTFNALNRTFMVEQYGWIEMEPVDVEIPIRVIGISARDESNNKVRIEIEV